MVVVVLSSIYMREGTEGMLRVIVLTLRQLPGVDTLLHSVLSREVKGFTAKAAGTDSGKAKPPKVGMPEKGKDWHYLNLVWVCDQLNLGSTTIKYQAVIRLLYYGTTLI